MNINRKINGKELMVIAEGRIDTNTAPLLENEITDIEKFENLIFDFKNVEYISSAGLRVLLAAQKRINKSDFYYFIGDFTKEVIEYILRQDIIYGDNGHDLALDMLFHFVKLFFKFHKNKEYSNLFENIRKIFTPSSSYYIPSPYKEEKNPKKVITYKKFNEEFCEKFKNEKNVPKIFK